MTAAKRKVPAHCPGPDEVQLGRDVGTAVLGATLHVRSRYGQPRTVLHCNLRQGVAACFFLERTTGAAGTASVSVTVARQGAAHKARSLGL